MRGRGTAKAMAAVGLAAILLPLVPELAQAEPRYRVTAHSHYGNGSATGLVRPSRTGFGYEVQLPTGFWRHCKRRCAETLRQEYLDFWETFTEQGSGG